MVAAALRRAGARIRPDFVLDAVTHLTPQALKAAAPGVRVVCFDIDGTVTDYHAPSVTDAEASGLAALLADGYLVFVVSNCYGERAREVHRLFEPLVTGVFTPEDCLDPADPKPQPRKHGKPAPDMILAAARQVQVSPQAVLMVGDQMFKDVLAARRAGALSLLVPRLGPSDHNGVRFLQRPLEWVLRPVLGLPGGRTPWPRVLTPVA
ncbi:MAG: HAD-IIIA family hydrolase [Propionibacteriaceae bacterium]|nr:HAD-IIIA family hydrolase [Propionibacteriaceae bacterium]